MARNGFSQSELGNPLTEFLLKDACGRQAVMDPFADTAMLLVVFTEEQCADTQAMLPELKQLVGAYPAADVMAVGVCISESETPPPTETQRPEELPFPHLYGRGRELAAHYGIERTPELFLFDQCNGRTYRIESETQEEDAAQLAALRTALEELLGTPGEAAPESASATAEAARASDIGTDRATRDPAPDADPSQAQPGGTASAGSDTQDTHPGGYMPANTPFSKDTERRVMQILNTLLDNLGGMSNLMVHHKLDLLPSLVEAAYILVLQEEEHRDPEQIASTLEVSRGAVESVLSAPMSDHPARALESGSDVAEFQPHAEPEWSGMPETNQLDPETVAGAIAKFAYSVVQRQEVRPPG